jgi:hypothetical protein
MAFIRAFWRDFLPGWIAQILFMIVDVASAAVALRNLVNFLEDPNSRLSVLDGWVLAISMFVLASFSIIFRQYAWFNTTQIGTRVGGKKKRTPFFKFF